MNTEGNTAYFNESQDIELTNSNIKQRKIIYFFLKRFFDIICSLFALFFLLPISFIIKICYMFSGDFHSIFYTQKRIGKNGKIIYIYKFRSMVYNAENMLKDVLKNEIYLQQWQLNQKLENDPRITKIGKFLRNTSLDELPQFINVLVGDMSLIGPRPLVEGELDMHGGNHELYEKIKPGITGWWASHGRSSTSYEERLALEYYYIHNCSISLDIKCIIETIKAVIYKKGAK